MDYELQRMIRSVTRRFQHLRALQHRTAVWLGGACVLGAFAIAVRWLGLASDTLAVPIILLTCLAAALLAGMWGRRKAGDPVQVAREIETAFPSLDSRLLTALDASASSDPMERYLATRVAREAISHGRFYSWQEALPAARYGRWKLVHFVSLLVFAAMAWYVSSEAPEWEATQKALASKLPPGAVKVEPGDTEVEQGSYVLVEAHFGDDPPRDVRLVATAANGKVRRLPMEKSLDDPVFARRLDALEADMVYHVQYGGKSSEDYQITVFQRPDLEQVDATLDYPDYTKLAPAEILDTRRVTAVEGTEITWTCRLNKEVSVARLVAEDGRSWDLIADAELPHTYATAHLPTVSSKLFLELEDEDGRTNSEPIELEVQVVENQRPELRLRSPYGEQPLSPLQEVDFDAETSDDFGITQVGLRYTLSGGEVQEIPLGDNLLADETHRLRHALALEELKAKAYDLFSYSLWAEDVGPDGNERRTYGDLYFASIRPFEEIMREANAGAGGGGAGGAGGGGEEGDPLRLQQDVIRATWNVQHQRAGSQTSEGLPAPEELETLAESQRAVLEKAQELSANLPDDASTEDFEQATESMREAIEYLEAAPEDPFHNLSLALGAEQRAYEALLRLQGGEHQVSQGSPGQSGGGGGGNISQQQLQQLELSQDQNRYETQSRPGESADAEQQERNEMLRRLKDLARRQQDMNRQYRELQTALNKARSPEEREEIERRLKRLREQQEQVLRDVDQLRQRMDQPENRARWNEERQQLTENRENVRRALDSLEEGMVSRALSAGSQAQRGMDRLQEAFRQQSSSQFADEARQLTEQARDLENRQEDLARRLNKESNEGRKSLRDGGTRTELAEEMRQQSERLEDVLNNVRQLTEQAEATEPVFSRALYETFRSANQQKLEETLDAGAEMLERGFVDQMRPLERSARSGIQSLREDVERAAERVLGDRTEGLRRAREEIEELARGVTEEMPQSGGQPNGSNEGGSPAPQETAADQPGGAQGSGSQESPESSQQAQATPGSGEQGSNGEGNSPGQSGASASREGGGGGGGSRPDDQNRPSGRLGQWFDLTQGGGGGGATGPGGPITGEDFMNWSERMRDVEEMLENPDLRNRVARVRERVRELRVEFKRHSRVPQWSLVQEEVVEPMLELRDRIAEELARQDPRRLDTPIDRDPVPAAYADRVARYYERLGSGQ